MPLAADHPDDGSVLDALVENVRDARVAAARADAIEARLLAAAVDLVAERVALRRRSGARGFGSNLELREVAAELSAAMRLSDRTVQARMGDAATLVSSFPTTLAVWEDGEIDAGHVWAIVDAGAGIEDPAARRRYETLALNAARSATPTSLRSIVRTLSATVDPDASDENMHAARVRRTVRVFDLGEGMARLLVDLPATLAYAILDRLTQMARSSTTPAGCDGVLEAAGPEAADAAGPDAAGPDASAPVDSDPRVVVAPAHVDVRTGPCVRSGSSDSTSGAANSTSGAANSTCGAEDDPRSMDERRADILADLLLAGAPAAHGNGDALAAISATVQVTVPVLTLAGEGDEPAVLSGYGPIDTATARRLAGNAIGWDRVMTHPASGLPLAVDRYRPGSDLARFLQARDEHCRFPGCRMAPRRCDIDHTTAAALGGATRADNLAHLCRRHHTLKHHTAWTVVQREGGVLEWTAPTGRRYADDPPRTVRFVPERSYGWESTGLGADPPPF